MVIIPEDIYKKLLQESVELQKLKEKSNRLMKTLHKKLEEIKHLKQGRSHNSFKVKKLKGTQFFLFYEKCFKLGH